MLRLVSQAVLALFVLALVSACGVKGDVEPPRGVEEDDGPRDQITYP